MGKVGDRIIKKTLAETVGEHTVGIEWENKKPESLKWARKECEECRKGRPCVITREFS